MINLPQNGFANLTDTPKAAARMTSAIDLCREKNFWVPAFILASASLDRLGGGSKKGYLDLLKNSFPELCKHLSALDFYEKFRNGIIHDFSPKPGFALANNSELSGAYFAEVQIDGTQTILKALNVEKFLNDVISLTKSRAGHNIG